MLTRPTQIDNTASNSLNVVSLGAPSAINADYPILFPTMRNGARRIPANIAKLPDCIHLSPLPAAWTVEEGKTYFVVKDHDGQQLLSRRRTWGLR